MAMADRIQNHRPPDHTIAGKTGGPDRDGQ
jgi:hypothetical protein